MKKCSNCNKNKELSDFGKDITHKDGFKSMCRYCRKEESSKYYKENKENINKRNTKYMKTYRENKKDFISERNSIYYLRKKDEIKKRNLNYSKNNPHIRTAIKANYRALTLNATPKWLTRTQKKQISEFYKESKRLTKETGIKHHVDHVIPLQGKNVRGLHVPWNLQILTESENCSKSNKVLLNMI